MRYSFWKRNTMMVLLGTAMGLNGSALYAQQSQQDRQTRNRSQEDWLSDNSRQETDGYEADRSDSARSESARSDSARSRREQDSRNQRDQRDQRGQDNRESMRDNASQDRGQQRDHATVLRLDPRAWVTVGTDYDNDGRFDAYERIYLFDLERARRDSSQRQNDIASQGRQQSDRGSMSDRRQVAGRDGDSRQGYGRDGQREGNQDGALPRTESVRGTITQLASVRMSGADKSSRLAKVKTQDGKQLTVCLGDQSKLSKLNLQRGDQVSIQGVKARLNDRPILMVTRLQHDGQSISADLPDRVNLKRAKAELISKRTVRFKNFDQPFIVGQVETKSGNRTLVNFGPAERVNQLQLAEGDSLRILARQGTINGQSAMIAEEIRANGKTVQLPRPQDRERFRRSNRDGNDRRSGNQDDEDMDREA